VKDLQVSVLSASSVSAISVSGTSGNTSFPEFWMTCGNISFPVILNDTRKHLVSRNSA
jgi:hypothetical protein